MAGVTNLLILPVAIPFLVAIVTLLLWKHRPAERIISLVGAAAHLAAGLVLLGVVREQGILALYVGNWLAPFGITLVADLFSAIMVSVAGLMGLAVGIFSLAHIDAERERFGYYPLLNILLMGVSGAFLTGDMFNLYVWFEVMLISSFVLMALGGERHQLEGAIKYVTINLVSSAIFLAAVGILYSLVGTLNMADAARELASFERPGLVAALSMMFLVAFGIKSAIFPLFFWLPDSYHTPPVPVTTIFSALLTKVGVYALVRVFTLLFADNAAATQPLLLTLACLTMVTGVLGAVAQMDFRRLLSFHIVSQIGYLLMGLALGTQLALAGTVFFMVHVILSKSALFLVSGVVYRLRGTYNLKKLGGLYKSNPGLAVIFLVAAFSLAGIPPLSGFWAKFLLVRAGLEAGQYVVVGVALFVGMLTLFSMVKIWTEVFWKPAPTEEIAAADLPATGHLVGHAVASLVPLVGLTALIGAMGLLAQQGFALALAAATQLLNPLEYIATVLGGAL